MFEYVPIEIRILTFLATSGACATIASDALMNPFDGMLSRSIL